MIKYEIAYIDKKDKSRRRIIVYIEAENLVELYKLLEKLDITHIIDICVTDKEVKQ